MGEGRLTGHGIDLTSFALEPSGAGALGGAILHFVCACSRCTDVDLAMGILVPAGGGGFDRVKLHHMQDPFRINGGLNGAATTCYQGCRHLVSRVPR